MQIGTLEVSTFLLSGTEEEIIARGNEQKNKVVMAVPVDGFGIRSYYAINSCEMAAFLREKVAPEANKKIDKWTGYITCATGFINLDRQKSDKGNYFTFARRQVMTFGPWLRAINHHCIYLKRYVNASCYHFNWLKNPDNLLHSLIKMMISSCELYLQNTWVV